MRNAILRFPTVLHNATPVRRDARLQLTCRWERNPDNGRLEQHWALSAAAAEPQLTRDAADAAA